MLLSYMADAPSANRTLLFWNDNLTHQSTLKAPALCSNRKYLVADVTVRSGFSLDEIDGALDHLAQAGIVDGKGYLHVQLFVALETTVGQGPRAPHSRSRVAKSRRRFSGTYGFVC